VLEILDVERIAGEEVSDEDVRMIAEMEVHPEIRKWDTDYIHHSSDFETNIRGFRKFLERVPEDEDQLCLLARLDGKVVGFMGIHRFGELKSHVGDVGIMVHSEYQRRGIGTKLLEAGIKLARLKGFKRLEADTLATNIAMREAADKAGFRLEGIRRKDINMHGQLRDSALYAILL